MWTALCFMQSVPLFSLFAIACTSVPLADEALMPDTPLDQQSWKQGLLSAQCRRTCVL